MLSHRCVILLRLLHETSRDESSLLVDDAADVNSTLMAMGDESSRKLQ